MREIIGVLYPIPELLFNCVVIGRHGTDVGLKTKLLYGES